MILCDLCGNQKECFQKEIDGREFDICTDCWRPLEEKLRGKGRSKRKRETVFLPPPITPEPEEPKTPPRLPPKIIGQLELRIHDHLARIVQLADQRVGVAAGDRGDAQILGGHSGFCPCPA